MTLASVRYYELSDDLPDFYGHASPVVHMVDVGVEFVATDGRSTFHHLGEPTHASSTGSGSPATSP